MACSCARALYGLGAYKDTLSTCLVLGIVRTLLLWYVFMPYVAVLKIAIHTYVHTLHESHICMLIAKLVMSSCRECILTRRTMVFVEQEQSL